VTLAPEVRSHLSVYPFVGARSLGVDAFVTDRFGGVSEGPYESLNLGAHVFDDDEAVTENRRRVARAAGVELERLVIVRQVHGVQSVDARHASATTSADIIVTDDDDVAVAVLVADCVPVLLIDEATRRVVVAHAGWRGLRDGVVASAVRLLADPARVHAFVGPCISFEGYQVGPEVAAAFAHVPGALHADEGDRSRLDLRRVALHELSSIGVPEDHLEVCAQSTDGGETFFSDRTTRPCGRFALVAKRAVA